MSWFSELNTVEKRTFYSALGGWALDALDFMVFTFVIAAAWGIGQLVSVLTPDSHKPEREGLRYPAIDRFSELGRIPVLAGAPA